MNYKVFGNGLIATAIKKSSNNLDNFYFFASGVSNSLNQNIEEFEREKNLLIEKLSVVDEKNKFIYFSTCSIPYVNSPYITHKIKMEDLVKQRKNFHIFRLPQVVGYSFNKFTLTNHIRNCIVNDKLLIIQKYATRNIIDVEDVVNIAFSISSSKLYNNQTINIASPYNINVCDLVGLFENILHKKAICEFTNSGYSYDIDTKICLDFASSNEIFFSNDYVKNVISKYYMPSKYHKCG